MKYRAIFSVCKLVRERLVTYEADSDRVSSPEVAAQVVRCLTRRSPTEWMVALYLDARFRLIGCSVIARGGSGACGVLPRDIFRPAFAHNASSMLLAHNHPSGDPEPSQPDKEFSAIVRAAGEMVGIPLVDSIVVTDHRHVSMAERLNWGSS